VKTHSVGGPFTYRYTVTLVADMHRNLLKGEEPFAFILEMSSGLATDGQTKILEIHTTSLHQRTPFFAGRQDMMNPFLPEKFLKYSLF
jgi:fructose-1,6-bisphosphatase I